MTPEIFLGIAAFAAPLGGYLLAVRRFSGRIESTEASELWQESRSIRDWSKARIDALEQENDRLHEHLASARERIAKLEARLGQMEGTADVPDWLS